VDFLFADRLAAVAGAHRRWARRRKIDLAELIDEPARATRCTFPADESL
jgi:hypothetical protein